MASLCQLLNKRIHELDKKWTYECSPCSTSVECIVLEAKAETLRELRDLICKGADDEPDD